MLKNHFHAPMQISNLHKFAVFFFTNWFPSLRRAGRILFQNGHVGSQLAHAE